MGFLLGGLYGLMLLCRSHFRIGMVTFTLHSIINLLSDANVKVQGYECWPPRLNL